MITEIVYIDRDNTNDLLLKADGVAVSLASVSRMVIAARDGSFAVDSSLHAQVFDWATGVPGKVVVKLGHQQIPIGNHLCGLIVYDPANTAGIKWGRLFLKVR